MSDETTVRAAFASQAQACRELGSPFTALLCETLGSRLDRTTPLGRRILDWPDRADPGADAMPLRLAGALHALARRGSVPALAALYPPHAEPDPDALWRAVTATIAAAGDELTSWLDRPPQTNEVARAAAFMAGLLVVADRTNLPITLHELGCSAGLNLMLDRFVYRLGELSCGAPQSPVRLAPGWTGPPPPTAEVRIQRRRGVDLTPLDVTVADDRERLLAYVWADQTERLARATAAIAIAAADPPTIDRRRCRLARGPGGDCAGSGRRARHAALDRAPVYACDRRERIATHAARVGAAATPEAPFAWLAYEIDPTWNLRTVLRLRLWPDGAEAILATGDPHAREFHLAGRSICVSGIRLNQSVTNYMVTSNERFALEATMDPADKRKFGRVDLDVTVMGYGAAPIGNIFRPVAEEEAAAMIHAAWQAGVRYFDTAPMYGHGLSEARLGAALRWYPRDEYVVSTRSAGS